MAATKLAGVINIKRVLCCTAFFVTVWFLGNINKGCDVALSPLPLPVEHPTKPDCFEPMVGMGVPTFKTRNELGKVMQLENFTLGIELGVQKGLFSKIILNDWSLAKEYHLVDLWAQQENYEDMANVNQELQNQNYAETLANTDPWKEKIHVCRNYTTSCVKLVEDEYFDFIYVDARHDFKGVLDDLIDWWPKLRPGGIMAGHDYVTQDDGPMQSGQDWTTNYDGTKDHTNSVVKGAVDIFARTVCRQVTVAYRERVWNTWAMRK